MASLLFRAGGVTFKINLAFSGMCSEHARSCSLERCRIMTSRRNFLKHMSGAMLTAGALPSAWILGSTEGETRSIDVPGEEGMIVRSYRFLDLETPVEYFDTWITPVPHFFVRNHMHEPSEVDPENWKLTIGGEVEKSVTLSLAELSKIEAHEVVNTLECAGNGRSLYRPQVPGVQ